MSGPATSLLQPFLSTNVLEQTGCLLDTPVRGTVAAVRSMITDVEQMQWADAASTSSSSVDWIQTLTTTFKTVDRVRSSIKDQKRAGAVLLVTTSTQSYAALHSDEVIPVVLQTNTHQLPITVFDVTTATDATDATRATTDLAYFCTGLGTGAVVSSTHQANQVGMYYEHLIALPVAVDPMVLDVVSAVHFWGKPYVVFHCLSC